MAMLGPNLTQERFRLAAYYLTDLAFQASGDEPLAWGEFMERYTAMYPCGHQGLPDEPVTTYVDALRVSYIALGSATARRAPQALARECFVCMASGSVGSTVRSRHHAIAPRTPSVGRASTSSPRPGASLMRSWPTTTKSSGRTGHVTRKRTGDKCR
jgi:hypothetical protein